MGLGELHDAVENWAYTRPLWQKIAYALVGGVTGYLVGLKMGWPPRYCAFSGGLLGIMFPFLLLCSVELVLFVFGLTIILGLIYWAFGDTFFVKHVASDLKATWHVLRP